MKPIHKKWDKMACVLIQQNSRGFLGSTQYNLKDVNVPLYACFTRAMRMRVTKALGLSSWSCGSLLFPMLVFVSFQTISKALGSGSVLLTGYGRATATFLERPQPT